MLELKAPTDKKAIDLYGEVVEVRRPSVGAVMALRRAQETKGTDPLADVAIMVDFLVGCGLTSEQVESIALEDFESVIGYIVGPKKK